MARVDIPVQVIPANGGIDQEITWTAADQTDKHSFVNTGRELLLMKSATAGAKAATIVSVANKHNRTGDGALAPTGEGVIAIAGPFLPSLWSQSGGVVHVDIADETDVTFAVVRYTSNFS